MPGSACRGVALPTTTETHKSTTSRRPIDSEDRGRYSKDVVHTKTYTIARHPSAIMATPESLAATVRTAITAGNASSSTVTTLQTLLSSVPRPASQLETASRSAPTSAATSRSTKPTKPSRPAAKTSKEDQDFQIHEDTRTLQPKARYALATEIVNISLKVLSEAITAASKAHKEESSDIQSKDSSTPQRHSRHSSLSQRALQLRSGNTTPVRRTPTKQCALSKTSSQCAIGGVSLDTLHLTAVAECARLGFSSLGAVDGQNLGIRALPKLQLETGMLSFVGMMLNLRLDALAVKELRSIKRRLESLQHVPARKRSTAPKTAEHETLASLLRLNLDFELHPEAIPAAITYQLYVLRVITLSRKSATIEDAWRYLKLETPGSPASLLVLSAKNVKDGSKAARQLEALAQNLLQLCPSVSSSADEAARDPCQHPAPLVVFQLQILALQLRQEAWKISKRIVELRKEVTEPFSKCMSTLVRRLPSRKQAPAIYQTCIAAYNTLGLSADNQQSVGDSNISRSFALLAESATLSDESFSWAELAVARCRDIESTHSRYMAAMVLKLSLFFREPRISYDMESVISDVHLVTKSLHGRLAGNRSDYEQLIADLARLTSVSIGSVDNHQLHEAWKELVRSAAGFASGYAKLFPGNGLQTALTIVNAALLYSGSSDELISWVSKETARLFWHAGVLRTVADSAAKMPMFQAWNSSSVTIAFTRVLRATVIKAMKVESEKFTAMILDDDDLEPDESGALLECQLNCALDMAHKSKYQKALKIIVPYVLKKLLVSYPATVHPIRRARIAALAMRVREEFPELLPPHILQAFLNVPMIDIDALGKDLGLQNYASDIIASIGVSLAFHKGPVAFSDLKSHLDVWQTLIETSEQGGVLDNVVDNPSILLSQLTSLEEYAGVMGDDLGRLRVARMLLRASKVCHARPSDRCSYSSRVASTYLSLGLAETAGRYLEQCQVIVNEELCSGTPILEYYLCAAEHLLALDKVAECQNMLDKAHETRVNLDPSKVKSHQSKTYKLLHGRGWHLQSRCFLAAGMPHDSLRAAKRSAQVFNSIWSGIERATDQKSPLDVSELDREPEEPSMEDLGKKVSKLNLKPERGDSKPSPKLDVRGAVFWPVARLLCRSLMHLSDVYVHHGVYNEANYSSEQALRIAESIQSRVLLSKVTSHRSILLAAAGRIEDAELCLAQNGDDSSAMPSLAIVERLRAKCALALKSGELENALKYTSDAVTVIRSIRSDASTIEKDEHASQKFLESRAPPKTTARTVTAKQPLKTRAVPKPSRAVVFNKSGKKLAPSPSSRGTSKDDKSTCYMLQKVEAQLIIEGAMISLKLGRLDDAWSNRIDETLDMPVSFTRRHFEHKLAMRKVVSIFESDFAYNVLPESTLCSPAVRLSHTLEESTALTATKGKRPAKGGKRKVSSPDSLESLLLAARQCLMLDTSAARLLTTSDTHVQYSLLSNTAMLLSATSAGNGSSTAHSIREALAVDYPRVHAAECQLAIAELEKETFQTADLLAWPTSKACMPGSEVTMDEFQKQYVDILPTPWTAVSLGLNQDCDELYITRYRRGQSPLVLRLPFSRQKSEDADDDMFDFHMGREELKEIIELSNYSCHNSIETGAKGAKNNWWSEREALDVRLHELLLNIENIWLGGFRGVFAQHARDVDQLNRFRKDFEIILDRHLPSRRATKRGSKKLSLDDQVLELFIGLGSDQDGEVDLDEPLSDLLYFVVDMLQFSGERNAYDEVDFDSMAIEVLDALRTYHDNSDVEDQDGAHLILVLDRRLQAFPWESLPFLQDASVSRVDSMLCLRDRILEMRRRFGNENDRYTVTRQSGSYILNPSADLKNTETILAPELSKLGQSNGAEWKAIVRQEPTEDEFSTALTTSSMLLYFGHGSGSQYIRPRAIRRLDSCSEVVWLMGCSSGAVTEHGELEAHAVPLAYLLAGQRSETLAPSDNQSSSKCMSVLATLWDVTDKDIDRFSLAVGEEWGLWSSPRDTSKVSAKTPRKREVVAAPSTPQRGAKTPKTPKVRKTPAPARTPARSRSRVRDVMKEQSLVEAVSKSRDACYLRYLNGAAPVVYGVPVYLGQ